MLFNFLPNYLLKTRAQLKALRQVRYVIAYVKVVYVNFDVTHDVILNSVS